MARRKQHAHGDDGRTELQARLAAVQVRPEDYVAYAFTIDTLFEGPESGLRGQALYDHYAKHQPRAILDEEGARYQALRGDMRDYRE